MGNEAGAVEWLLEESEPSIRYLALTELLGRPEKDPAVKAAKKRIGKEGWAAEILAKQKPGGWWVREENLYRPKYLSTNWMLLILSDLGLTKDDPRIRKAADLWRDRFSKADGGFGSDGASRSHLCIAGNTARALIKLGYSEDAKVRSALDWLVKAQATN
ncbi:MAG TPA: nitrogen fixation protein NifH, partial [Spirochaetia bacterium]|nr:nitrogen fixation protein NifH [Spirochaetia bacterium]